MEAEVGDEDDEEDEDDDYGDEDLEELSDEELPRPEDYIRRMPIRPAKVDEEIDAEAEEQRLKDLYGRYDRRDVDEESGIPKGALLPKATDPKLWLVKCRPGKERDVVAGLLRGLLELDRQGQEVPPIFSAVCRDSLKGYIYIEAYKPNDIINAVQRLRLNHVIYASPMNKPSLVPMAEMAEVLAPGRLAKTGTVSTEIVPGSWVRVKRGKYSGDMAQVIEAPESITDNNSMVRIRLIPRLSYRSQGSAGLKDRPPARLFDPQEAAQYGSVTKSRGLWVYAQECYKDGFLVKEVKLGSLVTIGVDPKSEELERFGDEVDVTVKSYSPVVFVKGDLVVVREGDLKGIKGVVESVQVVEGQIAWVSVRLSHEALKEPVSLRADQLSKYFDLGDQVRVQRGPHLGETGMVVDLKDDEAILLCLATNTQLVVPLSDLSFADAQSNVQQQSTQESFELDDLVQSLDGGAFGVITRIDSGLVHFLDQSGLNQSIASSSIRKLDSQRPDPAAVFKQGDRVQIDSAQGSATLAATIIKVHRMIAFCRTLDTREVVVRRFNSIHRLTPYMSSEPQQTRHVGGTGRHLIGKSVTISGGTFKGYAGIVKDVQDSIARVELHTNSKIVSVPKDRVIPVATASEPSDRRPVHDHGPRDSGKTPTWNTSKTPAWSTSKTPAWNTSKTPAWNAQSGKTPAWNAQSGKTPAWNSQSSKTPAWNDGKTPAWNDNAGGTGGRTPAWTSGGLGGAKTPVWSQPTAPTPAWTGPLNQASSAELPVWAQEGVLVRLKGSSDTSGMQVLSSAPGRICVSTGQSYRPTDLESVPPAKKDRVKLLSGESTSGIVIGLDGPDAVIRLDESSSFRIVPLANLGKIN